MNQKTSQIADIARGYFKSAGGCHGWDHVERVYHLALHLSEKEGANSEIVGVAALLHDIARSIQDQSGGKICHAQKGAKMAKVILEKEGFGADFADAVCHCILAHRNRGTLEPKTLEAKIIADADNLDAIGAVGIGRAFQFSGEIGSKLHNNPEDVELEGNGYSEEDTAYNEFRYKLSKHKDKMHTKEGSRLAAKRHQVMVEFFTELDQEVKGFK